MELNCVEQRTGRVATSVGTLVGSGRLWTKLIVQSDIGTLL